MSTFLDIASCHFLGNSTEESDDTVVTHVLPQPAAESQR